MKLQHNDKDLRNWRGLADDGAMSTFRTIPGTSKIIDFDAVLNERREMDRGDWANQEAGEFFNLATKRQKAEHDARAVSRSSLTGEAWRAARDLSMRQWRHDTKEARALCDETAEWFLSHDEISTELDAKWTALCDECERRENAECDELFDMAAE